MRDGPWLKQNDWANFALARFEREGRRNAKGADVGFSRQRSSEDHAENRIASALMTHARMRRY